ISSAAERCGVVDIGGADGAARRAVVAEQGAAVGVGGFSPEDDLAGAVADREKSDVGWRRSGKQTDTQKHRPGKAVANKIQLFDRIAVDVVRARLQAVD